MKNLWMKVEKKLSNVKSKLQERKGDVFIETLGGLLAIMILVVMVLAVLPVFVAKQELNEFADRAVRVAEVTGRIGTETNETLQILSNETGITPAIQWDTNYVSGNKIQLNEPITLTLEHTVDIGFGGLGNFPIKIRSTALGRSEVYWKN